MNLLSIVCLLLIAIPTFGMNKDIVINNPFYLRARIHDFQSANVQFEITRNRYQRSCRMYQFTIRHNDDKVYSMPNQYLTFWRNSLELKHLTVGKYNICATICSEYFKRTFSIKNILKKTYPSKPISTCVSIDIYRTHFLILTLYLLVITILIFSQIIFSLRKRKFQARIKTVLVELERSLQRWHTPSASSTTIDKIRSSTNTLHDFFIQSASSIEHYVEPLFHITPDKHEPSQPTFFHIDSSYEDQQEFAQRYRDDTK